MPPESGSQAFKQQQGLQQVHGCKAIKKEHPRPQEEVEEELFLPSALNAGVVLLIPESSGCSLYPVTQFSSQLITCRLRASGPRSLRSCLSLPEELRARSPCCSPRPTFGKASADADAPAFTNHGGKAHQRVDFKWHSGVFVIPPLC